MNIEDVVGEFLRYKYTYRMGACASAEPPKAATAPTTTVATTAAATTVATAVEPKPPTEETKLKTPRWAPDDAPSPSSRRKRAIPKTLKRLVWDTYIGSAVGCAKCCCCKARDIFQYEFHCGHVEPESKGGKTSVENLRPICAQCNLSMGARDMNEFMKACGFK